MLESYLVVLTCVGAFVNGLIYMAFGKCHFVTAIVSLLERDAELTAQGLSAEEVAAGLEVSTATLYNWRKRFGEMSSDEAAEYV